MSSIFYSTQEEQELIASNIKKMLNDRGIKTSVNLLSIIKNHLITVDNDFLIGYLNDSKMNSINNVKQSYSGGIIIWDCSKNIAPDEKYYNMHIDTFNKSEFNINLVSSCYIPKHQIVNKLEVLKNYPNILENDFPVIMWYDPVMRYYGGRKGDMVKIERHTESGINNYYRICK